MQLYKPNKVIKGSALSVNFSAKTDKEGSKGDKSFYFQLISQTGWDESSRNGTFKDGKKIIVKFATHEISGILAAIRKNTTLAATMGVEYVYHDGEKTASTIYFGPHFKKEKQGDKWVDTTTQVGFGLRVVKTDKSNKENKDSLSIGFTYAETELLRLFLEDGLSHIFAAMYSDNINRAKNSKNESKEPPKAQQEPNKEVSTNSNPLTNDEF